MSGRVALGATWIVSKAPMTSKCCDVGLLAVGALLTIHDVGRRPTSRPLTLRVFSVPPCLRVEGRSLRRLRRSYYHVSFTSDTPCRGSTNVTVTTPFFTATWRAGSSSCSWLTFSSSAYCGADGGCGEPIFCQAS